MSGFDYKKAAGMGTDTIDRGVLGMPFINIIQKGSPEFDETHPKFKDRRIEGCRPGQVLFEPERAILPTPVTVIPLDQTTLYTEWKPNKGGFVGNRPLDVVDHPQYRKGVPGSPTEYREYLGQNELVYTIYFMVLFEHQNKWNKGIIAFTSTQLKVARQWSRTILSTKIEGVEAPPIFACSYKLSTFADSNAKGGFFSWQVERSNVLNPVSDQQLLEQAFTAAGDARKALPRAANAQPQAALVDSSAGSAGGTDVQY
jgi:hypothetical protein